MPVHNARRANMKGWITEFLEGTGHRALTRPDDFTSGLVSVPLTITHPSDIQDTAGGRNAGFYCP